MERHIAVMADLTTLLRVQMDSVFASLDTLRAQVRCARGTRRLEVGAALLGGNPHDPAMARPGPHFRTEHLRRGSAPATAIARIGPNDQWRAAACLPFKSPRRPRHHSVLRSTTWRPGTRVACRSDELPARGLRCLCQRLATLGYAGTRPRNRFCHATRQRSVPMDLTLQGIRFDHTRTVGAE